MWFIILFLYFLAYFCIHFLICFVIINSICRYVDLHNRIQSDIFVCLCHVLNERIEPVPIHRFQHLYDRREINENEWTKCGAEPSPPQLTIRFIYAARAISICSTTNRVHVYCMLYIIINKMYISSSYPYPCI